MNNYLVIISDTVDSSQEGHKKFAEEFASTFGMDKASVERTLKEFPAIIKRNLSKEEAELLHQAIESLGGIGEILSDGAVEEEPVMSTNDASEKELESSLSLAFELDDAQPEVVQEEKKVEPAQSASSKKVEPTLSMELSLDDLEQQLYQELENLTLLESASESQPKELEAPALAVKPEQAVPETSTSVAANFLSDLSMVVDDIAEVAKEALSEPQPANTQLLQMSIGTTSKVEKEKPVEKFASKPQERPLQVKTALSIEKIEASPVKQVEEIKEKVQETQESAPAETHPQLQIQASLNAPKRVKKTQSIGAFAAAAFLIAVAGWASWPFGGNEIAAPSTPQVTSLLKQQKAILGEDQLSGESEDENKVEPKLDTYVGTVTGDSVEGSFELYTSGETIVGAKLKFSTPSPTPLSMEEILNGENIRTWLNRYEASGKVSAEDLKVQEDSSVSFSIQGRAYLEDGNGSGRVVAPVSITMKRIESDNRWEGTFSLFHDPQNTLKPDELQTARRSERRNFSFRFSGALTADEAQPSQSIIEPVKSS